MRIEILSRLWVADKKHAKCRITHNLYIHNYNFWNQDMITFQKLLESSTRTIHRFIAQSLEPIILIDHEIHSLHTAYVVVIAYILRYTDLSVQDAIQSIQTKTVPFSLSKEARRCLSIFYSTHNSRVKL